MTNKEWYEEIPDSEEAIMDVRKVGYKIPYSWEEFIRSETKGRSKPVGVLWVQRLGYWFTEKAWNMLLKSRHVHTGWEGPELMEFRQKTKWVNNGLK